MPNDDDDDLFDAPRRNPSNKIVHQPAGAQWSLDRLSEVENLYQTSFKKKLPLVNRGQGSIHNKWGYDHRNSADVSINPSTPEGQQFIEQLKKANVPFLAFSGAIPGVATGPHVHLGFPSKRSQQRYGIGAQRKTKGLASDDLFEKSDDDLFDQPSGQTQPPIPRQNAGNARPRTGQQSAPNAEDALRKIMESTNRATEQLQRQAEQQGNTREREQQVRQQVEQDIKSRRGPYGSPTWRGALHVISDPVSSLTGLFKSDEEQIAEETATRLKAAQLSETPEVTEIRKEYGQMSAPVRSVAAPLARGGAGLLKVGGGIASAFGIAPNRFSEWANKRAEIIEAGAANAPLREGRGLSSLITGETGLEEVERGVPEKVVTGLADLGVGLGQIILLKKATKLPFNQLLALEAAAKNSNKPASEQLSRAAEGYALGTALERITSRAANAAISGIPTAAQTGEAVAEGRMSPLDAAIQTGIQTGAGAILTPKRQPSALERGLERLPAREQVEPDAVIAARLRGDLPQVSFRERMAHQGSVPERPEALTAQVEAVRRGNRPAILITPGTQRPKLPEGMRAEKTTEGIFYYDPSQIDVATIRAKVADGSFGELLGHVEPKSESTTEAVVARDSQGNEVQSSAVSPENVEAQSELLQRQYPDAKVKTGGPELAAEVIAERTEPQKFYHRDFGEVIKTESQEGARGGRTRVQEANDPEKIHYVKTAQLTGAGNQRMVPVRSEPRRSELPDLSREKNYRRPLKDFGDTLYRESSAGKALEVLPTSRISTDLSADRIYLANHPDLALGQGVNKGIRLEFDPAELQGNVNTSKPAWEPLYEQGQAELVAQYNKQGDYQRALKAITIGPDAKITRVERMQLDRALKEMTEQGWSKIVNDDGSTTYRRTALSTPTESPTSSERIPASAPVKPRASSERLVTGERADTSLSQFVRKQGGIVPAEMYKGELDRLRRRETGTTGLINQNARQGDIKQTADIMMQAANDAGFRDKNGQPFENPGDFLRAVERDVAGEKTYSTQREVDAEIEKGLASYYADQQKAIDAEVVRTEFLESGRGAELFDKIADRKANDAEREEFLRLAQERGIDRYELDDLIADARAETETLQADGLEGARAPSGPAEQLGFVQEGLTQESALPPKPPDQRARLIREEQDRQAALNPERSAAQAKLEEIRRRGMTVEDYARQPDLTGNVPDPKELRLLRELERGTEPQPSSQPRLGEAGILNISPEKVEYKRATTPVLKDVERATMDAENKRPSLRQFGRRATSYLQRALVAEFTPLREVEAKLYGKENVPVVNLARKFEQVAGAPAKAQADVIDFRRNVIDPIRKSADDFNSYLFLKRVEDRLLKEPDRKRVADWTIEKAQAGLDELKAKVGNDTFDQLERAGGAYQKEMDKALRLQVESGRMSEELYNQIVDSRDFYAPFKVLRHIEESDFVKGSGRRVATTQELSKKIVGIDKEDFQLGNILQASAEQIVRSRILAEKNLKMLELDKLADLDTHGDLIRRVEGDERPRQGFEFVRFLKDGKEQALEVEHVVADAVQGLNPKQASLLAQAMAMARRPLQLGATSANAGFQAVNLFFADLPRQALVSRYGVKSPKDLYQFPLDWAYSLMTSVTGNFGKPNKLYMDWLRSGAANSTVQRELTPEAFRPTLGIAKPGVGNLGRSVIDSVAKFSNAIEETSKILGLQRGMRAEQIGKMSPADRQQAMEKIAAEVRNYSGSPDFARKGSETRELNLLFMFFNARLQGLTSDLTRFAGQTGKKEAAVAWARLGTAIGIPTTMLALLNNSPGYKDDYEKIPDWEKKSYWMIPRESYFKNEDTGESIRDYWRIPKRELGQLFGNTIESAVEFAYKRDPKTAKQWSVDMLENISPISIQGKTMGERAESAFSSLNPALKLPAEAIMNRDTFRHRPIVPEYMENAAPAEQYRESTPRPYRRAGRALGVSPLQLEHAVEGATGSAASQFSIRPQPEGRSSLAGYPIARRFFRSGAVATDESQTQSQQDVATKQLQRRRERQEAIKKFRAGQISKEELDRLQEEDRLTESDVKRVQKEAGMTPRQVGFYNKAPVDALAAYERMTPAQRDHVKDIMARKAYTLLNSEALTDAQKEEFKARIELLGISPEAPRRSSSNPFSQRFRSSFK